MSITSKRFGPFEILQKLGQGSFASVFKARYSPEPSEKAVRNLKENAVVALKIANWMVVHEQVLAERFHNEYRITSQLQHPSLVRAVGYGVESELPYLILEYIDGPSLDKQIQNAGPLPVAAALPLFKQVTQAVSFIHKNKLVHRDIKPGNILIDEHGDARLTDLGLIKDLESESLLTHSRVGLGTLGFSAPEQFDDAKNVDHRCDIYGLGATLYFALTGKFPFGPGSQIQMLKRKLEHRFIPLSHLLPDLCPALDQTVIRALHPDPAIRPASAEDFLAGILGQLLAAAIPTPQPHTEKAATGPDRRANMRYPLRLSTTLDVMNSPTGKGLKAHILDVSAEGLCLESPQHFEPDTVLQVDLPSEYAGILPAYPVRTRWIKRLPDQNWLFGCTFLRPLDHEDLDRFLFIDLSKTEAFQSG